jgi:hypothetical protein
MSACTVMNLSTLEKQIYTCSPKEAVIAAYAQSQNDWNTWQYESRYSWLVEENEYTYICGNFSVFKDGREF